MKVKTSINLDTKLINTVKRIANNRGTTQTKIITEYIKQGIKKEPIENKTKLRVLVERDPNKNLDDLVGFIKTDKPVNAVELINEVRRGE